MTDTKPLALFEGLGVEIEYMIVDQESLAVLPITDRVIRDVAGDYVNDVERGVITWSNELVLHVIETKTTDPAPSCQGLADAFQTNVEDINARLAPLGARLMPSAMHPTMDPYKETVLWPHGNNEIYDAFNRIFNCQGHGWSNLQSAHLNFPFADDAEFGRLHAAIRLILPILPALAASSPIIEGRVTGLMDNRLDAYRKNSARIPSITGHVIPEPVFTITDYEEQILRRMYADIAPYDPEGILQFEWLNARGAIARFERNTIEIRVLDTQECPAADLAIIETIVAALKAMCAERWIAFEEQQSWAVAPLEEILLQTVADAESAIIQNTDYLRIWGVESAGSCSASELWRRIAEQLFGDAIPAPLIHIIDHGSLARRIQRALGGQVTNDRINALYAQLCACLDSGQMFTA